MKSSTTLMLLALIGTTTFSFGEPPPEFIEAGEQRRKEIPLGGDYQPDPKAPVFVAVGHGARVLLSRDDGKTWTQAFFGYPGADHGGWATNAVAYTNGVFALPIGWVNRTSYLASEDGVRWRHLTNGSTKLDRRGDDPSLMPTAMSVAGGKGVFVFSGYMQIAATPDFGKTWSTFSLYSFKDDPRKLVTHHIKTIYLGDQSGRFLALGNDRSKEDPNFGNLFASDDLGKTWKWLAPKGLDALKDYSAMESNGKVVLIIDKDAANAYRSLDGGESWQGPFPTGAGRRATLSVVNDEFWLAGKPARASADGQTWRDLPGAIPPGRLAVSKTGTLISIDRGRFNILRSADKGQTWSEVHTFEPPQTEHIHGAQGLRDIVFGYTTSEPIKQ